MEIFVKIIQLVLALSILIFVHEMGHFLFSRLFKIRIDKFYLFFNPSFSILRAKRIDGKWQTSWFSAAPPEAWKGHEDKTEWGLGWLPLGGYCKIAGMIDESMDKEQMKQEPKPWEYRTKPAWQRMFVIIGGVVFNVILAICIYWGILFTWGDTYLANKDLVYGVQCDTLAQEIGFRNGDRILYIDGKPVERFTDLQIELIRSQATEATVIRNNDTVTFSIDERHVKALLNSQEFIFEPRIPFVISAIPDTSHNAHAGLLAGDRVIGVDSTQIFALQDIQAELARYKNQTINLQINRNDTLLSRQVIVDANGKLGVISNVKTTDFFHLVQKQYGFFEAFPAGVNKGFGTIKNYLKELKLIFSPKTEAYKSVGSFITIGKIFPGTWDWFRFWTLTAFLSIMLAVINILPIPGLDGGHLMFVLYEMITRRKPSEKIYETAQWVGFLLLIGIMILAFGNDIMRTFFN